MKLWLILILTVTPLTALFGGQQDGNILLQDDFATRANRWTLTDTAKLRVFYGDEQLQIKIISPGSYIWTTPDTSLYLTRYRLIVTAEILDGGEDSAVGAVFNYQDDDNFYILDVEAQGVVTVKLMQDGVLQDEPLLEGEIEPARVFELDLHITDGLFDFAINGTELPALEDYTLKKGIVGLYSRAGRGSVFAAFDDFRVLDILND